MRTWRFCPKTQSQLGETLEKATGLSPEILEDAAKKGALWLQRGKGKVLRERDLEKRVSPKDTVFLYYDARVLALPYLKDATCLFETAHYGVWFKEAGVVTQGTQSGDHASLLRFIELRTGKEVYLIHRLDRETPGLMLFAYTADAAAKLGTLFQKSLVKKEYEAIVLGELQKGAHGTIDVALDDKSAITHYEVLASDGGKSLLKVEIETGRLHQIRRHLDHIGHPVIGDPKYGRGNKNREGLKLLARGLSFEDPWAGKLVQFTYQNGLTL